MARLFPRQNLRAFSLVLLGRHLIGPVPLQQVTQTLLLIGGDWQRWTFQRRKIHTYRVTASRGGVGIRDRLHPLADRFSSFGDRFTIGLGAGLEIFSNLLTNGLARFGDRI